MAEAITPLGLPAAKTALCERTRSPAIFRWHTSCVFPQNCGVPFLGGKDQGHLPLKPSRGGGCVMPSSTTPNRTGNRLLDRLPREEFESLLPQLETISLADEEEVCHQNSHLSHVYFPTSGV